MKYVYTIFLSARYSLFMIFFFVRKEHVQNYYCKVFLGVEHFM